MLRLNAPQAGAEIFTLLGLGRLRRKALCMPSVPCRLACKFRAAGKLFLACKKNACGTYFIYIPAKVFRLMPDGAKGWFVKYPEKSGQSSP